jgi:hypothetical protein
VAVRGLRAIRTRHDHDRVVAQVAKLNSFLLAAPFEMFGERIEV